MIIAMGATGDRPSIIRLANTDKPPSSVIVNEPPKPNAVPAKFGRNDIIPAIVLSIFIPFPILKRQITTSNRVIHPKP